MKYRMTVPFLEDRAESDLDNWLGRTGWSLKGLSYERPRSILWSGRTLMYLTLHPYPSGGYASAEITVTSGATLIYDDADGSLAVSVREEKPDAPEPADQIPVLYKPGDTIHMTGQPPNVLGTVLSLLPRRYDGQPAYEIVIFGGDFHRKEHPHSYTVRQTRLEPADEPPPPRPWRR